MSGKPCSVVEVAARLSSNCAKMLIEQLHIPEVIGLVETDEITVNVIVNGVACSIGLSWGGNEAEYEEEECQN